QRRERRKERRRRWHPHAWTAATGRWDDCIVTIVGPRCENLVRDEFPPRNAGRLLWPIRNAGENRGVKRVEAGSASREYIDERLMCRSTGSSFTRRTDGHCALHLVRFAGARNAVDRVI